MTLRHTIVGEIALGADLSKGPGAWSWTPMTDYARYGFSMSSGNLNGQYGSDSVPSSTCSFTADNTGGRWVQDNPSGAWYGSIHQDVPIRFQVGTSWPVLTTDSFTRSATDSWGSTESDSITSGYPWSLSGTTANFDVSGTAGTIVVTEAAPVSYYAWLPKLSQVDMRVLTRFTAPLATGSHLQAGPVLRGQNESINTAYFVSAILTTANTIFVEILRVDAGVTTVVVASTATGLTHAAATPVNVLAEISGRTIRAKVWQGDPGTEPGSWNVSATETATAVLDQPGFAGWHVRKNTGNTNVNPSFALRDFEVTVPPVEFAGLIESLPKTWDGGRRNPVCKITATGPLQRVKRVTAARPVYSSLRRATMSPDYPAPIGYWPFEDGRDSLVVASGLPNTPPVYVGAAPFDFASESDLPGSDPLPTLAENARFSTTFAVHASTGQYAVAQMLKFKDAYPVYESGYGSMATSNGLNWRVVYVPGTPSIKLAAYDGLGSEKIGSAGVSIASFGLDNWLSVIFTLAQSGSDTNWTITVRDETSQISTNGTLVGYVPGMAMNTVLTGTSDTLDVAFGHFAVWSTTTIPRGYNEPWGWKGVGALSRVPGGIRELALPVATAPSDTTRDTLLGEEGSRTALGLAQEGVKADEGLLVEDLPNFGLLYIPRDARYNRPTLLTLSTASGHIGQGLEMIESKDLINEFTAKRTDGGQYRYEDTEHKTRFMPAVDGDTFNVYADSQLQEIATHKVALGTIERDTYAKLRLDLSKSGMSTVLTAWQRKRLGALVSVTNTLPEVTSAARLGELIGFTQDVTPTAWVAHLTLADGAIWQAMQVGGTGTTTSPRFMAQAAASTLNAGITTTATSLSVASVGPVWKTGAYASVPIIIGGEIMALTNVAGAASPQTFTVARSSNGVVKAHSAGAGVRIVLAGVRR